MAPSDDLLRNLDDPQGDGDTVLDVDEEFDAAVDELLTSLGRFAKAAIDLGMTALRVRLTG